MQTWSARHDWVARTDAYDDHRRAEYERAVREQFEADRRQERENRQKIVKALRGMLGTVMSAHSQQDITAQELNALSNAARTILEQSRAEFNDLPTQRSEVTGSDGGALTIRIEHGADDADRYG